jgi:endogenous inhibitor of DNA gyrase (YacG/DUF329 family)
MTCPICGKATEQAWRPFCSRRCADLDLAKWLGEGYRIAGSVEDDPLAEDPAPPPSPRPQ